MNTWDKCKNCGGERGLHHYETDQCPVGGREAPIGRKQEWKTATFEIEIDAEPENLDLIKAEQQFTGFDHLYKGGDIVSLVEAMGLRADEWEQLKVNMPWLSEKLVEEVDQHFKTLYEGQLE